MSANSALRRSVKLAASRFMGDGSYSWLQALAMAWDVKRQSWAEPEMELIETCVNPGDWVLDVGAHYGMWTHRLDRAVGPSGRVFAFEPVPFTFSTLCKVSRLLGFNNVELLSKGCAEVSCKAEFTIEVQNNGKISAGQSHISSRVDDRPGRDIHVRHDHLESVHVDLVRIDDVIQLDAPVSFIKMDIEGAELFALKGASDLLESCHPTLVLEINPWFLRGFNLDVDQLVDFLSGFGYQLYRFDSEIHKLKKIDVVDVVEDNYVFVHPSRCPSFGI